MESKSPTAPNKLTAAIATAFALGALPAAALPTYTITQLAPTSKCGASTINNVAGVAGSCNGTAVTWQSGVATSLGRLAGGTYSQANYVNSFGVAVGDGDTGNGRPQGWVETSTGLFNFFPNNGGNTHALFIGDNGYIGGYYTKSLSGNTASWRGAIWTVDPKDPRKYRETDLPVLPGGINTKLTSSVPMAFNQLGQAAGYGSTDQTPQHGMFWKNDAAHTIVDLGVFPGDWTSLAWGMNDLGQVVGESHPGPGSRPVMWNSDAAHTRDRAAGAARPQLRVGEPDQHQGPGHRLQRVCDSGHLGRDGQQGRDLARRRRVRPAIAARPGYRRGLDDRERRGHERPGPDRGHGHVQRHPGRVRDDAGCAVTRTESKRGRRASRGGPAVFQYRASASASERLSASRSSAGSSTSTSAPCIRTSRSSSAAAAYGTLST